MREYKTRDGRRAMATAAPDGQFYGVVYFADGDISAESWIIDGRYIDDGLERPIDLILPTSATDEKRLDDLLMHSSPNARSFVPDALEKIAGIYRERNGTYGDNYLHAGEVLMGLFPRGLHLRTEEDFNRFHLIIHLTSKLSRYCMSMELRGEGHEDSLADLAVYATMLRESDVVWSEQRKEPGSASEPEEKPSPSSMTF